MFSKVLGIEYVQQSTMNMSGYSDSDWGGDMEDRKSTSSFVFQVVMLSNLMYIYSIVNLVSLTIFTCSGILSEYHP